MKTRKNYWKNTQNTVTRSFGKCRNKKIIKMEKETAIEQLFEVLNHLDADPNSQIEYAMEFSSFSDEEVFEFDKKAFQIIALRSNLRGTHYRVGFHSVPIPAA